MNLSRCTVSLFPHSLVCSYCSCDGDDAEWHSSCLGEVDGNSTSVPVIAAFTRDRRVATAAKTKTSISL